MDGHRDAWPALARDGRVVDAAVVLLCLGLTAMAVRGHWSALPPAVIAVTGAAASLAQWWRRRWPVVAAVAGSAGYALSGNPGPALVGLYAGGAYAGRRYLGPVAVAGWAGFAGWAWLDAGRLSAFDAATAALGAVPVAAGMYVATRRALAESWRQRAEQAEAERRLREEQARMAERTRIAGEMHDVLAHKVSLIALHAGALELTARDGLPKVEQGAALIRATAREALQELRSVLGMLRSADGDETVPPTTDLASLVGAARRAGQRVDLLDRAGSLPPPTARVVYRVAQEGLTNARKHAPDAAVTLAVQRDDATVTVTVRNPPAAGRPLDLPGSGAGLVGLAERVRLAGGELHCGPTDPGDGPGWYLRAVLPCPTPAGETP
jgi:signal transduction histidine kinase